MTGEVEGGVVEEVEVGVMEEVEVGVVDAGVSRGYTDHHQGRAIHMADSRIH